MFKPNKWIAGILGLIFGWLGLLYVARLRWAIAYFVATILIAVTYVAVWLYWQNLLPTVNVLRVLLQLTCGVHAFRVAVSTEGIAYRPWFSRWYGLVSTLFVFYMGIVFFRAFLYEPFRMPAGSMLPTINAGSYMIVQKLGFGHYDAFGLTLLKTPMSAEIHRGDIIVFLYPEDTSLKYIKRVIGLPGDDIKYDGKRLTVNDKAIPAEVLESNTDYEIIEECFENETYRVKNTHMRPARDISIVVPDGNYFVMGDNRDDSRDSRVWGFLPAENIVGRLVYVIEPPVTE